jgi:hypothetical protein
MDENESADAGRIVVASEIEMVARAVTVGARIRIARRWAGLTMGQAARLRGCTVPEVSDAETSELATKHLGLWVVWAAVHYGVSVRWLQTGVLRVHEELPLDMLPDEALLLLGAM